MLLSQNVDSCIFFGRILCGDSSQQQACIDEIVAIDHPLHGAHAGMQVAGDAFQGEVNHRRIDLREQHAERSREQDQPRPCLDRRAASQN